MTQTSSRSAAAARELMAAEIALPSRIGYTALLLVAVAGAAVTGSLLATEPHLPARTRVAFAALTAMGVLWAAFAAWVLARRRALFGRQHVVAGWMAVVFSTLLATGSIALARSLPGWSVWPAVVGVAMLAIAVVVLVRARRRVAALARRRAEIERQLNARAAGAR